MKKTNLVIVAIAAMVIAVVSAFQANENREKDKEEIVDYIPATKSYFYIDLHGVIHTSLDCLVLKPFSNETAGGIPYYAIVFIKGEELKSMHFNGYCSQCVNDVCYEKIKKWQAIQMDSTGERKEVDWEQYRVTESWDEYE